MEIDSRSIKASTMVVQHAVSFPFASLVEDPMDATQKPTDNFKGHYFNRFPLSALFHYHYHQRNTMNTPSARYFNSQLFLKTRYPDVMSAKDGFDTDEIISHSNAKPIPSFILIPSISLSEDKKDWPPPYLCQMPSSTVESTITGSSNDCTELTSDRPAAPTTTFNQDKAMLDFQPSVILEYCNAVRNAHTLTTQTQTFYHDNNASTTTTTDERQYQEPDLDWEQHRQNWILEHSKIEDNNDPFEILTADSTDLQHEDQTLILNDFVRTIFYQSGADV